MSQEARKRSTLGFAMLLRIFVVALVCALGSDAASVLLLGQSHWSGPLRPQLDLAARFYGLNVKEIALGDSIDPKRIMQALADRDTIGVLVAADALAALDRSKSLAALRRPGQAGVPLMIVHSAASDDPAALARWTGGVTIHRDLHARPPEIWQLQARKVDMAGSLAGLTLGFTGSIAPGLVLPDHFSGQIIVEASSVNGSLRFPELLTIQRDSVTMFVMAALYPASNQTTLPADEFVARFSPLAPLMIFLRQAAGDRAWHAVGLYANLTIDDPWLLPQYGSLDYQALLGEMAKHDFHTTVAFIPWNFDRSHPEVVSLFRRHPGKFSIAIHGNNHDHREFGSYAEHPLAEQLTNVKQARARMNMFRHLTGIAYDPVMVFPHAVAPSQTFRALKTYNFWATTNSENVPLGESKPADALFALRPETLAFNNFLSVKRYSAEVPVSRAKIAINAFLGNPLLFYVHQGFFWPEIGAFDSVADYVNGVAPHVHWGSLGEVAQHLYFLRLRPDRDYDVLAFSPDLYLTNPQKYPLVLHVSKPEDFTPPIDRLAVNGHACAFRALGREMEFEVPLSAGETAHVEITYRNDFNATQTTIAKSSLTVGVLRRLSDYRDITLSKSEWGRKLVGFYSRLHDHRNESKPKIVALLALILASLLGAVGLTMRGRRKRSAPWRVAVESTKGA